MDDRTLGSVLAYAGKGIVMEISISLESEPFDYPHTYVIWSIHEPEKFPVFFAKCICGWNPSVPGGSSFYYVNVLSTIMEHHVHEEEAKPKQLSFEDVKKDIVSIKSTCDTLIKRIDKC